MSLVGEKHPHGKLSKEVQDLRCKISLPLQRACLRELDLLGLVNEKPEIFYDEDKLKVSVRRYEKYWLPFLASISDSDLTDLDHVHPLDIHWVWHVHMLAPVTYRQDCSAVIGDRVLNHALPLSQNLPKVPRKGPKTRELWEQKYPGVPFEVDWNNFEALKIDDDDEFESKITFDIVMAAKRQQCFNLQVLMPHYKDKAFLESAITRYCMFLLLKQKFGKQFNIPYNDIVLVWHAH